MTPPAAAIMDAAAVAANADADAATLPDYLRPGLDIVLVGLNPSAYSARAGHYFANPRNRFWPAVNAAGLAGGTVGPPDDAALLDAGIGFTDLVKRPTPQASGLTAADYRRDAPDLRRKLLCCQPRIVCFQGITTYRNYLRYAAGQKNAGPIAPGRQADAIGSSSVFVVPSPSPANARCSLDELIYWYTQLQELRAELQR